MADQQQSLDPNQFDLNKILEDEANGDLPDDMAQQVANWRALGKFPAKRQAAIPAPPSAPGMLKRGLTAAADPTTSLPVLGSVAGGIAGAATELPGAAAFGAGAGQAGGRYVGEMINQKTFVPDVPNSTLGWEFGTGALGEGIGGAAFRLNKTPMSEIGRKTYETLGDKAIIPDLAPSTGWDFARNVAREGFMGRKRMLQREEASGTELLNKVGDVANKELPGYQSPAALANQLAGKAGSTTLNPTKEMAGREAQTQLADQFNAKTAEGKALYKDFMAKHGNEQHIEEILDENGMGTGEGTKLPTFSQLHSQRSDALEAGRKAASQNDYKGQMEAMRHVQSINDDMEKTVGPDVMDQYNQIGDQYGKIMNQYDNPLVRSLRENIPEEQLVDTLLNPSKMNTFAPFRDMNIGGVSMPKNKSISQQDGMTLIRAALGEEKFRQLRADTIMSLARDSSTPASTGTQMLDGPTAMQKLAKMPDQVQAGLFGANTSDQIQKLAEVAEHTQKSRAGSGALWIVMRQPSAALSLAGGIGGAVGLTTGSSMLGLATSGAIVLSPEVLSRIITSPMMTRMFINTAKAATPAIKRRMINELTATFLRTGGATALRAGQRELDMEPGKKQNIGIPQTPGSMSATIPVPPR